MKEKRAYRCRYVRTEQISPISNQPAQALPEKHDQSENNCDSRRTDHKGFGIPTGFCICRKLFVPAIFCPS